MSIINEWVITGTLSKRNEVLSGSVLSTRTIEGTVSIPDVIGDDPFEGPYEVEPIFEDQVLETQSKTMVQDLRVLSIQTYEVSNHYGTTFII